ncbi:MAG: type II toxin-antitoxin system HicB family antitoxin [Terriglobales bacterium]
MHVTAIKSRHASAEPAPVRQIKLKITIIVERDGDGYHAYCPAFKGLHVDGDTVDQAVQRAQEAVAVYIESVAAHNDPLPIGPDCDVLKEEQIPPVPPGALLRHFELQWPSLSMSGIS